MNYRNSEVTDVVIVLDDLTDEQTAAVVEKLKALGMSVDSVDNDNSIVEGCIDTTKMHDLHRMELIRYVRPVATYSVEVPSADGTVDNDDDFPERED